MPSPSAPDTEFWLDNSRNPSNSFSFSDNNSRSSRSISPCALTHTSLQSSLQPPLQSPLRSPVRPTPPAPPSTPYSHRLKSACSRQVTCSSRVGVTCSPQVSFSTRAESLQLPVCKDKHRYSKVAMAYRAIDDKIDLVRFIQAYESVLAAFGVDENPMTESEKESLKVAERIVFRLFWNDKNYRENTWCRSVPLASRASAKSTGTGTDSPREQRVTSSEMKAISAIVDEAYEGLFVTPGSTIEFNGKKDAASTTVTAVKEISGESDASTVVVTSNGTMDEGSCITAAQVMEFIDGKDQATSANTQVVDIFVDQSPSSAVSEAADQGLHLATEPVVYRTGKIDQVPSATSQVVKLPNNTDTEIQSKAPNDTVIGYLPAIRHIKKSSSDDADTFYEDSMRNPKVNLLHRWGCDRYAEWTEDDWKAEDARDEDAKREAFRLIELKHRLLPLKSGRLPYTYRMKSSTQNHRDSYKGVGVLWGVDVLQRVEELLNVKLQWTCEAGIYNDITIGPTNIDVFAADQHQGHRLLQGAYEFLKFWDWTVRQSICFQEGKVEPINAIYAIWCDKKSHAYKAYMQQSHAPETNLPVKVKRERSGSGEFGKWRERRTVSGASYVGKKRCISGGNWSRGKRQVASANCLEKVGRGTGSNRGLRRVRWRED